MSLAWSSLSGVIVSVVVATVMRPKELPRLPGTVGLRAVLHFGKHATGIYLFGQIGKSAPELIIGRLLGMAPVAFFSRANGLGELFQRTVMRAVLPVCLPDFAKESNNGEKYLERLSADRILYYGVGWPFFAFLSAMAFSAVRIIYGTQWHASVPLARVLCVVAAVEVAYLLATEVLIANGDVRAAHHLQFANNPPNSRPSSGHPVRPYRSMLGPPGSGLRWRRLGASDVGLEDRVDAKTTGTNLRA